MARLGIIRDNWYDSDNCGEPGTRSQIVAEALSGLGELLWFNVDGELPERLSAEQPDLVYNMATAASGEYRRQEVVALLEYVGIPFSGPGERAMERTDSRVRLKQTLQAHRIPTAAYTVAATLEELGSFSRQRFPVALQPATTAAQWSERKLVRDMNELSLGARAMIERGPVMVERQTEGATFACVLIGNGRNRALLPPVVVDWSIETPALSIERIPTGLLEDLDSIAREAAEAIGCMDAQMIEVGFAESGALSIVSIDPLPDLSCTGSAGVAALAGWAAAIPAPELIQRSVFAAAERGRIRLPGRGSLARLPRFTPPRGVSMTAPAQA